MSVDWTVSDEWDTCTLGASKIPGEVQVIVTLPDGLDVKKPKGGKKATIQDNGDPPAELTIIVTLGPEDLQAFKSLVPTLRKRTKTGARDPLKIVHPNPNFWGITTVTIGKIRSPMPETGGFWVVEISAYEWAPGPAKVDKSAKTPKSAAGSAGSADEGSWNKFRDTAPYKDIDQTPYGEKPSDSNWVENL